MKTLDSSFRDNKQDTRFYLSLFISIILHLILIIGANSLLDHLKEKEKKVTKINAQNILVLKRGRSNDKSQQNKGQEQSKLASNNINQQTISQQSLNENKQSSNDKAKLPNDKLLESNTQANSKFNPNNLKFLDQNNKNGAIHSNTPNKGYDAETIYTIKNLYGNEWGDLGEAERNYIRSNLREIARITQEKLNYPDTAIYLRQSGENALEFYLMPNGDIQDLRLLYESGFVLLDKNSLKTIEIAYKDYPRPSVRTLIRFRIIYN